MRRGTHLHFDCTSGIAGDMTLGALLSLGVHERVVREPLHALGLPGLDIQVRSVTRAAMAAFGVRGPKEPAGEPARTWRDIRRLLSSPPLEPGVARLARAVFERLAHAEAEVHGVEVERVHFHEVGGLDAIADIVGVAAAIEHLAPSSISCSSLPLGGGTVQTRHGLLPVPAPATVALLVGVPVRGGSEDDGELVTPTGAAIITQICDDFGPAPHMRLVGQGCGAGSREIPGRPNVLRVLAGDRLDNPKRWVEAAANIDDMSPELGAYAAERLLSEGARDVWQEPIYMKKGRAGVKLGFLCLRQDLQRLCGVLLAESTTIGVRYHAVERVESRRRRIEVETPFGVVGVKVSVGGEGHANIAPEFEDCRRAARDRGAPLKEVYLAALAACSGQDLEEEDVDDRQ